MPTVTETDIIGQCGCEIRGPDGKLAVTAMRAIASEADLIQRTGYRSLPAVTPYLINRVPMRTPAPGEAENPREYVEYTHSLPTTVVASQPLFNEGEQSIDAKLANCANVEEAISVIQSMNGSPGCNMRRHEMVSGRQEHRGVYRTIPVKTHCECILDFARKYELNSYLSSLRMSIPEQLEAAKEFDFARRLLPLSRHATASPGENQVQFGAGALPHLPQGGATIGLFQKVAQLLEGEGYNGFVEIPISYQCLQGAFIDYHAATGSVVQVAKWVAGELPVNQDGVIEFMNLRFRPIRTPHRVWLEKVGTNEYQMNQIEAKELTLDHASAGLVTQYRKDFNDPTIFCEGAARDNVEMIYAFDPRAFAQKPFSMVDPNVEGVNAQIWRASNTVRVVSGDTIPNNSMRQLFYFEAESTYKLHPEKPYLACPIAVRVTDYIQSLQKYGLTESVINQTVTINHAEGRLANANRAGDIAAGLDPNSPAPIQADDACTVTNSEGEFEPTCQYVAKGGATVIKVCVNRIGGYDGAVSLDYATRNLTATAGTHYTLASGTLNWADGVGGPQCFEITLDPSAVDQDNLAFFVDWSAPTGAALKPGACDFTTICLTPPSANEEVGETCYS